ncbi:hybrid histidine kinase/response regulator HrmK [Plectonema radiosum NIES-515]|uniref:histidine kinase n=1 Tax=Plectonema radiosum NIES-515 TaxID=2986073 RepID=A0ABT3AY82_9CYAN|nr:hybrid histidine kinase/response regulator HrmK [Plectonema radiosum]MCV3214077.1 hybrid histidine kinase/response regulator HrmK [Plectonema radiosum NIES-515]
MQQYSSLPEQNSQVDTRTKLLTSIEQLRADLWLECTLNKLQSRLNDCLLSTCTTEAEIFQTVVNELNSALKVGEVAIANFAPQETVGKICYASGSSSRLISNAVKKQQLSLQQTINIENLHQLENQQPPNAWRLASDFGGFASWLIIVTELEQPSSESLKAPQVKLTSKLMARAANQCAVALAQLRQIKSLQECSQHLESFNQQLERTNQLKNQFLANTSHEIRTPLSSIIGFTQLLLAQGYDPARERHQEYLNIIQSSGKHLLALINDILDLSKIEANQLEVQWETVNVLTLCRNVFALLKEKAANKNLKLCLEVDPNITTLVADSLRLKQMLLNLLFNGIKFTTTGSVGLKVDIKGEFMYFTVWDTGAGICKENQTELFQPYFQITNTATSRDEGTGLGLAVTQKLVEIHSGWLKVESKVNQGSRFTIVLPLTQEQADGEEGVETFRGNVSTEDEGNGGNLYSTSSSKILLVEDDFPNAKLIKTYLEKLGYQVTWVKNAAEMWQALTELQPAVILMDVYLPGENGLKLVQQLGENQQYKTIPIIAQTAMAMKGDREICLAAGVNGYISKPIDLPLLATLVAKYSKLGHGA